MYDALCHTARVALEVVDEASCTRCYRCRRALLFIGWGGQMHVIHRFRGDGHGRLVCLDCRNK